MAPSTRSGVVAPGAIGTDGQSAGPLARGNLTTAAGSGLPLPRSELLLAGKSIVRSMRRVTHGADNNGKVGDTDQLMGDAARIGALASILAPATGLASLANAGAGTDDRPPEEVVDLLRLNFGQLGYMKQIEDRFQQVADAVDLVHQQLHLRSVAALPRISAKVSRKSLT